jgi:secreted PhoX family phosphatase
VRRGRAAGKFEWEVFLTAGDPAYDSSVPADQPVFGSPDGLWVDPDGLIWIQTDISNSSQNRADRGYDNIGNNMMLVADPNTGDVRRFLTGPNGCEITGVIMTPDQRTLFVNVQHPGESTTFWNNQVPNGDWPSRAPTLRKLLSAGDSRARTSHARPTTPRPAGDASVLPDLRQKPVGPPRLPAAGGAVARTRARATPRPAARPGRP